MFRNSTKSKYHEAHGTEAHTPLQQHNGIELLLQSGIPQRLPPPSVRHGGDISAATNFSPPPLPRAAASSKAQGRRRRAFLRKLSAAGTRTRAADGASVRAIGPDAGSAAGGFALSRRSEGVRFRQEAAIAIAWGTTDPPLGGGSSPRWLRRAGGGRRRGGLRRKGDGDDGEARVRRRRRGRERRQRRRRREAAAGRSADRRR